MDDKEAVDAAAKANANFGNNLFKILAKQENLIMSPVGISSVLSMILLGAEGETASQLQNGLKIYDFDVVKNGWKYVLTKMKTADENFALAEANRIYYDVDYVFDKNFIKSTQEFFLAEPVGMDIRNPEQSAFAINQWIKEQTKEKIQDVIEKESISPNTRLVLVNGLYFKGDWARPFDKSMTRKGDFHVSETETVQTDFMSSEEDEYKMLECVKDLNGAIALELPYKGGSMSMVLILPNPNDNIGSLVEAMAMSNVDLNSILKFGKKSKFATVKLPRFKIESRLELVDPLAKLGMTSCFDITKANFSGMTGSDNELYVTTMVQKAFVEVNEEGTEASAATGFDVEDCADEDVPEFTCDRPFMFLIRDKSSGMILFVGQVMDPSK